MRLNIFRNLLQMGRIFLYQWTKRVRWFDHWMRDSIKHYFIEIWKMRIFNFILCSFSTTVVSIFMSRLKRVSQVVEFIMWISWRVRQALGIVTSTLWRCTELKFSTWRLYSSVLDFFILQKFLPDKNFTGYL